MGSHAREEGLSIGTELSFVEGTDTSLSFSDEHDRKLPNR